LGKCKFRKMCVDENNSEVREHGKDKNKKWSVFKYL
jgi:hypothetical protein